MSSIYEITSLAKKIIEAKIEWNHYSKLRQTSENLREYYMAEARLRGLIEAMKIMTNNFRFDE